MQSLRAPAIGCSSRHQPSQYTWLQRLKDVMLQSGGWGQTMSAYKEIAQQQARGFRDDVAKQFQRFSSADDPSAEVSSMQSGV